MYSPRVTQRQLDREEKRLSEKEPGFKITRLSVSEVIALNYELYAYADVDKGVFVKALPLKLRRAILSERALCKYDFRYFMTRYHHIMDWQTEQYVRMQPNVAQGIVLSIMAEQEEKKLSIDLQSLKARQLGITTLSEAVIEHRVLFHPNSRAAVGSANPDKSAKMVQMVEKSIDRIPFWIMPTMTKHETNSYIEFGGIGSWLSVYHGAMKTGFARGETPTIAHLSEVTEWLDPDADIDAALMFAMHKGPRRILILESTAGVIKSWFHKQWRWNKERWGVSGQVARLRPMFLPWFVGRDMYPTKTDERQHPIPRGWTPGILTEKHASSARDYVRSDPLLREALGAEWTMPREQQWWWEYTRDYYKEKGTLNNFLRECPSNDVECFSSMYSNVFDAEVLMTLQAQAKSPFEDGGDMYMLDGPTDEVREELKPERRMIDTDRKPLSIDKRYTLYPLRRSLWSSMMNPDKIIFVWEPPRDEQVYGLGVDTSKGLGNDASCVEVVRKATLTHIARQVCEFNSLWISANDLHPWVHCIARLYQTKEKETGLLQQPKIAVEVNNGGDACQIALQKMGWRHMHNWVRADKKIINEGKANYLGVLMNENFRSKVFGHGVKAIKNGLVDVDSPWLMDEISTLEKDVERDRIDHANECHDDRFVGLGIILVSLYEFEWDSLVSMFGKARIMTETQIVGEPKPKVYPRQPSQSLVARPMQSEEIEKVLWTPQSDTWEGYSQRFAPKWEG